MEPSLMLRKRHGAKLFSEMISQAKKSGIQEVVSKGEHGNALLDAIDRCAARINSTAQPTPTISPRPNDQPNESPVE
jgi:hypothetical protein